MAVWAQRTLGRGDGRGRRSGLWACTVGGVGGQDKKVRVVQCDGTKEAGSSVCGLQRRRQGVKGGSERTVGAKHRLGYLGK